MSHQHNAAIRLPNCPSYGSQSTSLQAELERMPFILDRKCPSSHVVGWSARESCNIHSDVSVAAKIGTAYTVRVYGVL